MNNSEPGLKPALGRLTLIDGQDFYHVFGPGPTDSQVSLEFLDNTKKITYAVFPVITTTGVCRIDAADHAVIQPGAWWRLWVSYPGDGGRVCWIAGPVERNFR